MEKLNFDVAIIGAGVAGMTAGIYLKRAGINCIIIEKEMYGGQINKAPIVENYPGYVKISGLELTTNIFLQVKKLGIEYITDEVVSVSSTEDEKIVNLKNKELKVKAIIIATGKKPRKLNVTNEEKLLGRGISYCATCDGNFFKDKDVAVIGGGSASLEEAIYLSKLCNKVTILNRSDNLRAEPHYQKEIKNIKNIEVKYNSIVEKFNEKDEKLSSIDIKESEKDSNLKVEGCFICIGYTPSSEIFKGVIELDKDGYIKVDDKNRTNVKGIYAAGDIVKKERFQLISAMNDGVVAASTCIKELK